MALEQLFNRRFSPKLRQDFAEALHPEPPKVPPIDPKRPWYQRASHWVGNLGKASPLNLPWECLDAHGSPPDPQKLAHTATAIGVKSKEHLAALLKNPAFTDKARAIKLGILGADLLFNVLNGQATFWGRNLLTRKVSGNAGFSGEFDYTSDAYREDQSKAYEQSKMKRWASSLAIAFFGAAALPLMIHQTLKSQGKNVVSRFLKQHIKAYNYTNTIFMSKWVIAWGTLTGYVLTGATAARDGHELREHLTKMAALMFFFFASDDIVSGLGGQWLERKKELQATGVQITKPGKWWPKAIPLQDLLETVGGDTNHVAYKLARKNYWASLLFAVAAVGVTTPPDQ